MDLDVPHIAGRILALLPRGSSSCVLEETETTMALFGCLAWWPGCPTDDETLDGGPRGSDQDAVKRCPSQLSSPASPTAGTTTEQIHALIRRIT